MFNNTHFTNNNNFSLSYDQRRLINMYQGYYDNINRQIDELYRAQNEIRESIHSVLRNPNSLHSNNSNTSNTSNTYENSERIYIDGRPYILEYQHHFIPNRRTPQNSDISNNNISDVSNNNLFTQFSGLDFLQNFYSSVAITPSQQQLADGTLICSFSQIINPINTSCPISLEIFEENSNVTQIRGCGHIFSTNNFQYWFNTHSRCPVCRYDIRDYVSLSSNSEGSEGSDYFPVPENSNNSSQQRDANSSSSNHFNSQNINEERNSNSNNPIRNITSNLSTLLINQLLRSFNTQTSNNLNYRYDSSNNQILFETFLD